VTMGGFSDVLRQNEEKLKLVVYFSVMAVLTAPLSSLWGTAWREGHIIRSVIGLRKLVGFSLEQVSVFGFGIFLGLLLLMSIDPKKRWQAALLWLGMLIALFGLQSMGLFLPKVDLVASWKWLALGIVAGVVAGGGRRLTNIDTAEAFEFRRASKGVYGLVLSFTVIAFFEVHVAYPELFTVSRSGITLALPSNPSVGINQADLLSNAVVSFLFVVTTRQFVKYDAEKDFFVLGPRESGKSLFLVGSYLEALERSQNQDTHTPMKQSEDLMAMVEELDRDASDWVIESTGRGEVKRLSFQYVYGSVFPTNIRLSGADYAGEYLNRLPDALTGALPDGDDGIGDTDETLTELANGVKASDTLLFMLDVERFVNNEGLDISQYFSILQATSGKDVIIIATKADTLAEEFRDERGLEAHRYFEDFKKYVNERMRQSEQVKGLINETAGSEIHPVYYQTRENEEGERVPMRDASGSVMTVGFGQLLNKLGGW